MSSVHLTETRMLFMPGMKVLHSMLVPKRDLMEVAVVPCCAPLQTNAALTLALVVPMVTLLKVYQRSTLTSMLSLQLAR
eukprot:104710-Ditylum_brightwellii.AAC.1